MIAAIYSRKSKFTGKGESIETQIQLCKEYAKNKGITEFIIYDKDEGFSGGNTKRPDFQRMINDAKNKKFDMLICYRLDRISRNVSDFSTTIELLNKYGIDFVSIREQFDTSTPMGRAMMYISSVFAQLERETIAERIRDNMMELAKTGRWLGGNTPFGFKSEPVTFLDGEMKQRKMFKLSPIDDEMELVKTIYELYIKLGSLSKVQKHLYVNDILTKNKSIWDIKGIQMMLRNPVYVKSDEKIREYFKYKGVDIYGDMNGNGILTYNKKDSKDNYKDMSEWIYAVGKHEGIIDSSTWLKVQMQLDENRDKAPRLVSGNYGLLNGLLKCEHCGAPMYQKMGHRSRKTGEILRYYICNNKVKSSGVKCKCKNIRLDEIEPLVIEKMFELTSDAGYIKQEFEKYKDSLKSQDNSAEIKRLDTEIKNKEKQISNLVDQLSLDSSIVKYIVPKIEELNKEVMALNKKKNELSQSSIKNEETLKALDTLSDMMLNFKPLFESSGYEGRKLLLKAVVDHISYNSISYTVEITPFTAIKKKSLFDVASIQEWNRRLCSSL